MHFFSSLRVVHKLALAFATIVLCILVLAGTAWSRIAAMQDDFESLVDRTLPTLTALSEVNDRLQGIRTAELKHLAALTMPAKDREEQALRGAVKEFDAALARYQATSSGLAEPALLATLNGAVAQFHGARATFLQMSNSAAGAETERAVEAADYFNGPAQQLFQATYGAVQQLWRHHLRQAEQAKEEGRNALARSHQLLGIVAVAAVLLSIALAIRIPRGLMAQLGGEPGDVAGIAKTIAAGDLTSSIQAGPAQGHSIMASMHSMQLQLAGLIHAVKQAADGILTGTAEIASASLDLSHRTEQQAAALQETAASMAELSNTVTQNAHSAGEANQLARNASMVAVRAGDVVNEVVGTMKGIHDASARIGDIIGVIDGIAFQTNILALNAAVEAARAGEQGRGFAVVASEVRALAGRSADAAKEIKVLIGTSVERVEQGSALVDKAGVTMAEVVLAIGQVTEIMARIHAASSAQALGVSHVDSAVVQMDQTTQQNAALVEEMAASAASLRELANQQVGAVGTFILPDTDTSNHGQHRLALH